MDGWMDEGGGKDIKIHKQTLCFEARLLQSYGTRHAILVSLSGEACLLRLLVAILGLALGLLAFWRGVAVWWRGATAALARFCASFVHFVE